MNIILSAINTKFTHKALSLGCLKSYWDLFHKDIPITIKEFDLNILNETIINDLLLLKPDVLAFSTYIWSVERIIAVSSAVKSAYPDCIIILGGPEVSYNSVELLSQNQCLDFIIRGEGEITFKELLEAIINNNSYDNIPGISLRINDTVQKNKERQLIKDLDILPSPFITGNYQGSTNFTYYEASRGCPSKCAYCLSSVQGYVRNHSIERVKQDLDWFFNSDYDQIRFADRTFNYDSPRAREIIQYIKANNIKCKNFHFEIQADFLTDEIIELLSDAPRGMFHLEIGVQSTNPKALQAVNRTFDLEMMKQKISKLREETNCYLHLDVLGGLPYDSYNDFCRSLDDVSSLKPEDIQISLVKVLHGTPFEYMTKKLPLFYMSKPPYTIVRTDWLTSEESVMISQISKLFEGIANTGRFNNSLDYIANTAFKGSKAKLFEDLVYFWRNRKYLFYNFSPENTVKHLKEYSSQLFKSDYQIKVIESSLDHELRLTLRSPNVDNWNGPFDFAPEKKPQYKLRQDLKGYWYKNNPISINSASNIESNYPLIYSYTHLTDGSPNVSLLKFGLAEAFTILAVQKKVPLSELSNIWGNLYPLESKPDFNDTLDKLMESGFILYTAHR